MLLYFVVVFLFYCTYLISCRSLGPKHTCIREMIFHWSLSAPLFETDYWNIPLLEGIWHYPCHTAVPPPLLSTWGQHVTHFFFLFVLLPPKNSTEWSSTAQYQYKQSSTALPEQTGNNFWSHLYKCFWGHVILLVTPGKCMCAHDVQVHREDLTYSIHTAQSFEYDLDIQPWEEMPSVLRVIFLFHCSSHCILIEHSIII